MPLLEDIRPGARWLRLIRRFPVGVLLLLAEDDDVRGRGVIKIQLNAHHFTAHDGLVVVDRIHPLDLANTGPVATRWRVFAPRVLAVTPEGVTVVGPMVFPLMSLVTILVDTPDEPI